jgi:hypothetical protein
MSLDVDRLADRGAPPRIPGFAGPPRARPPHRRRPVQPDLPPRNPTPSPATSCAATPPAGLSPLRPPGRARIPRHEGPGRHRALPVPPMLALWRGYLAASSARSASSWASSRAASSWTPVFPASPPPNRAAAVFDSMNATIAALHSVDPSAVRPRRLRPPRQLHGPPDRPLDRPVSRLRVP